MRRPCAVKIVGRLVPAPNAFGVQQNRAKRALREIDGQAVGRVSGSERVKRPTNHRADFTRLRVNREGNNQSQFEKSISQKSQ